MNDQDRNELRDSLGVPRRYVEDPSVSPFKKSFKKFLDGLPGDEITQHAISAMLWPVSLFYFASSILGAIVFELIFWIVIIFQGWPVYLVFAFAVLCVSPIQEDFSKMNRWLRYSFWSLCALILVYFIYPFDVRGHQQDIKSTSALITKVDFPTFDQTSELPTIYVDKSLATSREEILSNYLKLSEFQSEFRETCEVAIAAAKSGSGKLIWKETFDEIKFVFSNDDSLTYSSCEDFALVKRAELSVRFEPTYNKKESIDVWGRFDFTDSKFSNATAPAGTIVDVLFSDPSTGTGFEIVGSFELKPDWWGEVTIPLSKPMLAKLHLRSQNSLPDSTSETIRIQPDQ
jgi:hypothetical protein